MESTKVLSVEELMALDDSHVTVVFCEECGISTECTHDAEYLGCEW